MRTLPSRRLFVALIVTAISGVIFYASYFQQNAEAYLFPAVIGSTMLALSLLSLAREAFDLCVDDYQPFPFTRQLPAIAIMFAALMLIETLGMFTTTFLTLGLVAYWYSPQEDGRKRFTASLLFAGGFSLFMYLLFSLLLNVQLPRGILI
jgi:hypothetical protein